MSCVYLHYQQPNYTEAKNNSPRNENLNLLVRIKFLNLFDTTNKTYKFHKGILIKTYRFDKRLPSKTYRFHNGLPIKSYRFHKGLPTKTYRFHKDYQLKHTDFLKDH